MDFLDPKKRRRRDILNIAGYGLIAIALLFAVRILFYQASGFGLDKNGNVIQSGLVFLASTPSGAQVRVNGVLSAVQTDGRVWLVTGKYTFGYTRAGYRPWQQATTVEGGQIVRLDYAMLFPQKLATTPVKKYDGVPGLVTQSPDRRWLLVQIPGNNRGFDLYDLKNPKVTPIPTQLTLPANIVTEGAAPSWKVAEWSTDNQHVLLRYAHDTATEFIMLDRTDASKSVNLNTTLGVNPTKISLVDKKYDRYYIFDSTAQTVQTARLDAPQPQPYLTNVLDYQSYGSNVMLYASSKTATSGKVGIVLLLGGRSYFLREVSGGTKYLLNLTKYSNDWYVAIGASSENKVYIYKNPDSQLSSNLGLLVPVSVLKTPAPTRLTFSDTARFIMDENGSQFAIYDAEVDKSYQYDTKLPLDAPQEYAQWMDGNRLMYASGGQLVVFDFNHTNVQKLVAVDPQHPALFTPDFKYVYTLAPPTGANQVLNSTALRTPNDL